MLRTSSNLVEFDKNPVQIDPRLPLAQHVSGWFNEEERSPGEKWHCLRYLHSKLTAIHATDQAFHVGDLNGNGCAYRPVR